MSSSDAAPGKVCIVCGEDCSHSARTRDAQGRYYHRTCHEKAMRKQAATLAKGKLPQQTSSTSPAASPAPPVVRVSLKKPPPAPPASHSPPTESADPDLDFGLLDDLSAVEGQAAGVEREQQDCPSCGKGMPADAVICLHCGYNKQLGRRMGEARIEIGSAPPTGKAPKARRDPRPPTASRSTASPEGKEWLLGVVPIAVFVTLFFFARGSPTMAIAFFGSQSLFALIVHILVLISAFRSSTGEGFLCLCLPIYTLYWVFAESNSPALKWAYGAAVATNAVTRILDFESMAPTS